LAKAGFARFETLTTIETAGTLHITSWLRLVSHGHFTLLLWTKIQDESLMLHPAFKFEWRLAQLYMTAYSFDSYERRYADFSKYE
jgi:hypothetical protein